MKCFALILFFSGLLNCFSGFHYTRFTFDVYILDSNNKPIATKLSYITSCNLVGWAENGQTDSSRIREQLYREYSVPSDFFGKGAELGIHVFRKDTVIIDTIMSFEDINFDTLPYDNFEYIDTFYVNF
jgi:hypothetical protein